MNARVQVWGGRLSSKFLVIYRVSPSTMFRPKTGGRNAMKTQDLAYATFVGAAAVAYRDRLGRAQRGREKEGGSRAASAAPGRLRVRRRTCSGVRNQGRHELHLSQRLLGRERRRESCQAGCMQRRPRRPAARKSQRRRRRNTLYQSRRHGPLLKQRPVRSFRAINFIFARRNLQQFRNLFT